jgi:hypothetical protein
MKNFHTCLLLSGLLFLACLLYSIGFQVLWRELLALGLGLVPFILLEITAEGVHTLGWRHCLPQNRPSWYRLFQIRMAGYALNYLLPTAGLGGEAIKASLLFSDCRAPEAVCAVLTGKLSTGISQLLFVLLGSLLVIGNVTLSPTLWTAMIGSTGVLAAGMTAFFLLQKYGKLGTAIRWLAAHRPGNRLLELAANQINEVDATLANFYRGRPLAFVAAVSWQLAGHSIGILQAWWFLHLLHLPATFTTATSIWVLGMWFDMLTFAVPLNVGTLEGSRMIALKAVGFGTVPGLTYGIALRLAQLACAALGLIYYSRFIARSEKTQPCPAKASAPQNKLWTS